MKVLSKCMTVMVAGLVMSTGAYAQEIDAPKNNLGVATISAAQSEAGFLGLGATATGAVMAGLGIIVVARAANNIESTIVPPELSTPPDTFSGSHFASNH